MFWNRKNGKTTAIAVYDLPSGDAANDVMVHAGRREVALFRPPVVLGQDGETLPGVDRQMVANYLVATTGMLAEVDLGPVRVDWKARVGRFAAATMHMETWGQSLTVMLPVHVVSTEVERVMRMYQSAVCAKSQQIHRGHQDYTESNRLLRRAARQLEKLRDARHPHFTDAEFLFLVGQIGQAQVMNALVPLPSGNGEMVVGQTARVEPQDARLPAGG